MWIETSYAWPVNLRLARNARIRWSGWLIASLLFLQLASASYACTLGTGDANAQSMAGMPCAQQMAEGFAPALDPEQPGLCLQHCQGGSQTVDQGSAASPGLPALAALFFVAAASGQAAEASAWQAQQRRRDRAPPPPHSILHCCYRL